MLVHSFTKSKTEPSEQNILIPQEKEILQIDGHYI